MVINYQKEKHVNAYVRRNREKSFLFFSLYRSIFQYFKPRNNSYWDYPTHYKAKRNQWSFTRNNHHHYYYLYLKIKKQTKQLLYIKTNKTKIKNNIMLYISMQLSIFFIRFFPLLLFASISWFYNMRSRLVWISIIKV